MADEQQQEPNNPEISGEVAEFYQKHANFCNPPYGLGALPPPDKAWWVHRTAEAITAIYDLAKARDIPPAEAVAIYDSLNHQNEAA